MTIKVGDRVVYRKNNQGKIFSEELEGLVGTVTETHESNTNVLFDINVALPLPSRLRGVMACNLQKIEDNVNKPYEFKRGDKGKTRDGEYEYRIIDVVNMGRGSGDKIIAMKTAVFGTGQWVIITRFIDGRARKDREEGGDLMPPPKVVRVRAAAFENDGEVVLLPARSLEEEKKFEKTKGFLMWMGAYTEVEIEQK